MNIDRIVAELKAERDRVDQAIAALEGSKAGVSRNGRRRGGKRRLSAEGRSRIADAARRRWAKFRAAGKKK